MTTGISLPCSWLPPSYQAVTYLEVAGIEFTTAKLKRKEAIQMIAFTLVPPKNEITINPSNEADLRFPKSSVFYPESDCFKSDVTTWDC